MEGELSNVVPVTSGAPQGTVLGPFISLLFISDLTERITSSVKLYADDCLVYRTIHSSNDTIQLQEDLVQLGFWMNSWQMTLYPHKCSIMHVSNKSNTVCAKYIINGFPLNCVSGVKYLGVSISSNMSWSDHIDDICTNARKSLGFIRRNLRNCPSIRAKSGLCITCLPNFRACLLCMGSTLT